MKTLKFKTENEFQKWVANGNEIYGIRDTDKEGEYGKHLFDTDEEGYTNLFNEHVIDESVFNDMHSLVPLTTERKNELAEKYGVKIEIRHPNE